MRIVSLIASSTEIVCALGLEQQLVGRSHECDYPTEVTQLPVLSRPRVHADGSGAAIHEEVQSLVTDGLSIYEIDADLLTSLRPSLIITQDHCAVCAVSLEDVQSVVCGLTGHNTRVCTLHPNSWAEVLADIQRIGDATGVPERARALVDEMEGQIMVLEKRTTLHLKDRARPRVALLEWLEPPMLAGCWMPELARRVGCDVVHISERPEFEVVGWDDLERLDPDVVVISPCGYPLQKTVKELQNPVLSESLRRLRAVRDGRCFLADGNALFSRPGPRLVDSAQLLAQMAHPDLDFSLPGYYTELTATWP
jgi:iron complex transport system substrate-binding protein